MKKFKFTLQNVHNVREMRQENEQLTLRQIQTEVNQVIEHIARIEKMRFEAIENYTHRLTAGAVVNSFELELASNHFASLNHLQREAEKLLAEKKHTYNQQMGKVTSAMLEVKITGKLRENQHIRYQTELATHEQTALDEIVSTTYARRMMSTK